MQEEHANNLVDAYALGTLEPDEVDAVERHLETCETCRALAEQARATADRFLFAVPQVAPPPALRARVLQRVHEEAAARRQHDESEEPGAPPTPTSSASSASPDDQDTHVPIAVPVRRGGIRHLLRSMLGEESAPAHDAGELLRDLLADPACTIWPVAGTSDAPGASARLVHVPTRHDAVLVASGLHQPAPGNAYQVWLLAGGKPLPNTVFTVNHFGRGAAVVHTREHWHDFDTVAVTPEPESGSPGPTGPIVLAGALSA